MAPCGINISSSMISRHQCSTIDYSLSVSYYFNHIDSSSTGLASSRKNLNDGLKTQYRRNPVVTKPSF